MKNKIIQFFSLILMLVLLSGYDVIADSLTDESFLMKINSNDDVTACSITEDKSYFVFSMSDKRGYSSLYFTQYKNGEWDDVQPLIDLNSDFDDVSPYISPDGRLILFSSNRPGGLKNRFDNRQSYDIYFSKREGKYWSTPALLFGIVNTAYDELYPFISNDGKTLYFSRLIDEDDDLKTVIIKVKKIGDSWEDIRTVEIPKNFNADILVYREAIYRPGAYVIARKKDNPDYRRMFYVDDTLTPLYENYLIDEDQIFVSELDKNKVIVSSNLNGKYKFFIRDFRDFREFNSFSNAKDTKDIKDAKDDKKAVDADLKEEKKLSSANKISLMIKSDYYSDKSKIKIKVIYFASLDRNSWPVKSEILSPDPSGMIDSPIGSNIQRVLILPGTSGMKEFAYELTKKGGLSSVTTIKIEPSSGNEFFIKPVYFSYNSTDIDMSDIPYLHQLLDFLRDNEHLKIDLNGYSDSIGSYRANMDISVKRAEKIKEYLVKFGIERSRIKTKGFGYLQDNVNDIPQYHRRVDIIVK
nr:ompa motb domain protein [uncultured bacterium]